MNAGRTLIMEGLEPDCGSLYQENQVRNSPAADKVILSNRNSCNAGRLNGLKEILTRPEG